ncbi:MAG: hypothetical protein WA902_17380 [Thermosynechococcaceae cyanobacterium]
MKITYILKIETNELGLSNISDILGQASSNSDNDVWTLEITERDSDPPTNFVRDFLGILEGKYEDLSHSGIESSDISVWIYYEYDEQCNLEFLPEDMKRLGENGIALCISAYQQ